LCHDAPAHRAHPIDFDLTCVRCGANLRGVGLECGTAVAKSLNMREWAFASSTWLIDFRRGVTYFLAVLLAPLVLPLVAVFTAIAGIHVFPPVPCLVMVSVALPVLIGLIFGLALICAPQPDVAHPRYVLKLQGTCVVLLLAAIMLVLTSIAAARTDVGIVLVCSGLSCMVGLFLCSAISIRHLATRARQGVLRLLASLWVGSLSLLIVVFLFVSVIWPHAQIGRLGRRQVYSRLVVLIVEYVFLSLVGICYLLGLVVLVVCRQMLTTIIRRQEQQADAVIRQQIQRIQSQSQGAAKTPQ
jgi:hypothetical protein